MKKLFLLSFASLCCIVSNSQNLKNDHLKVCEPEIGEAGVSGIINQHSKSKFTVTPIWSEDFSSGIPSGWTNTGYNGSGGLMTNALWEYRGPNTTPNHTVGSRGAYNGNSVPLLSPTASNGFIIFDSDYLDNNGIAGSAGAGTGIAPTPHIGTLKTNAINLSSHSLINLTFHSTMRKFAGKALIAFSSNGGLTFPDTVEIHPYLAVNAASSNPEIVTLDVSSYIGGSSNAVLSFIFDGATPHPGANGLGYYRWMIDDLQIVPKEMNQLVFFDLPRSVEYIATNNTNAQTPVYGHNKLTHADPVSFSTAFYNSGINTQTNVYLKVEVLDAANNLLTTLSSALIPSVLSGDTITSSQLTTNSYTFPSTGEYNFSFYLQSDSINKTQSYQSNFLDTLTFNINDSLQSLDFGNANNSLGTPQLGNDGSAMAVKINLNAPDTIKGVWLGLSTSTVAGGDLVVELYDTANFNYINGFGASQLFSQTTSVNSADVSGNGKYISLNTPYPLSTGAYYMVVYMFSNNGANPITIRNDASITKFTTSAIMYSSNDFRWYSGYSNSNTFNAPFIRTVFKAPALSASFNIGNVSCKGDSSGSITILPSQSNVNYLWSTGDTLATITNLVAGNYSVTLSNGSISRVYNVTVTEPAQAINTVVNVVNQSCPGSNDGSADINPQGGTSPYSYMWSTGDTTTAINNLKPGNYFVTVTDANGCSITDSLIISPSPINFPKPNLSYSDSVTICRGTPMILDVNSAYDQYLWSNGDTNASIAPVQSGTYFLKVSSNTGCERYSDTLYLQIVAPVNPDVLLVTYDTLSGSNFVFFSKPGVDYLTDYNLYKNSQLYMTVSTSNPGLIVDQSPFATSHIFTPSDYNLSSTDSCGAVGSQGSNHTSIALNVTKDTISQKAKLNWNRYFGKNVSHQRIYKRINGTMTLIDSVNNSMTTYIDVNSSDREDYLIEAVFTQPTGLSTPFAGSISNLHTYDALSTHYLSIEDLEVYPNPATDIVIVKIPGVENLPLQYQISDISGRVVISGEFNSETNSLNIDSLSKGVYLMKINGSGKSIKLIKD